MIYGVGIEVARHADGREVGLGLNGMLCCSVLLLKYYRLFKVRDTMIPIYHLLLLLSYFIFIKFIMSIILNNFSIVKATRTMDSTQI